MWRDHTDEKGKNLSKESIKWCILYLDISYAYGIKWVYEIHKFDAKINRIFVLLRIL